MRFINEQIPRVLSWQMNPNTIRAIRTYQRQMSSPRGRRSNFAFGSLGFLDPKSGQISSTPAQAMWYRVKKGDTYWAISKAAYGKKLVKKGLYLINILSFPLQPVIIPVILT